MIDLNTLIDVQLLVDKKIIIETLTRCGICNVIDHIIYPTCYLWEQDNKTYVVHFKEAFLLTRDNSYNNISTDDILRRNAIIFCLKNWGLVDVDMEKINPHNKFIKVLNHDEKQSYRVSHKINLRPFNNLDS